MRARPLAVLSLLIPLSLASCGPETPTPTPPGPTAPATAQSTAPATSSATATPAAQATVIKRVAVSQGRQNGTSVTTVAPDGTITVALDVLENGRGPKVDATIKLGADKTIASFEAHGHHTFGTAVEETFTIQDRKATWKSREESGSRDVPAPAFFVPIADVPDAVGMLVQAALKAGGAIALLPGGEAHVEKTVHAVALSKSGERRDLTGYVITGLDLLPVRTWMNEDGTWFGSVSAWWSVVPEGFEGAIEPLIEEQNKLDRERDAKLAKELAHKPPAAGIAYVNARVLDVEKGKWEKDQTVIVVGDTITKVGASSKVKPPKDAEVVDLAGKALVPGLWDMHSHLGDADGALDIASGVTTARDVGNDPDKLDDFKKRYDAGTAVGPHVIRFGFIEGRNEKAASSKITAENEAEAKAAVEFYAKRNYEGIKIYNSMKPELVPLLAKEAHARGMAVTGHIPVHMLAHEAVSAGYDGIEHINMLFLNFFATHDTDTRTPLRFSLVGDKAGDFDLKSKPALDFYKLLRDHHTVIDPTVDAFEDLLVGKQGEVIKGLENVQSRLPVQTQRWFLVGGLPRDAEKDKRYAAAFDKLLAMVKELHDQKVTLVVGTDSLAGLMMHHELALYVRAGLTPAQALEMATIGAARTLKLDKKTGSIAAGKAADLVVVDGDPLARIDDLGKVVSTMRGGVVFPSAPLYKAVGVRPL
jgi:hypothetical protein